MQELNETWEEKKSKYDDRKCDIAISELVSSQIFFVVNLTGFAGFVLI